MFCTYKALSFLVVYFSHCFVSQSSKLPCKSAAFISTSISEINDIRVSRTTDHFHSTLLSRAGFVLEHTETLALHYPYGPSMQKGLWPVCVNSTRSKILTDPPSSTLILIKVIATLTSQLWLHLLLHSVWRILQLMKTEVLIFACVTSNHVNTSIFQSG